MSADQLIFSVQIFLCICSVAGLSVLAGFFIAAGSGQDGDE